MKTTQQYQQKKEVTEKDQEKFEKEAQEAFTQFMNAHFGDPACTNCLKYYIG